MFWGIFFINRDFIYPKAFEEIIPSWHNHLVHTLPLIGVLIESLMTEHFYEKSIIRAYLPTILFSSAYLLWYGNNFENILNFELSFSFFFLIEKGFNNRLFKWILGLWYFKRVATILPRIIYFCCYFD